MTATKHRTPTHTADALKRDGRRFVSWLEIGIAQAEGEGVIRVFLDRLPGNRSRLANRSH